jgi:pimeloyl-ACP methyl ester carboxylesterase
VTLTRIWVTLAACLAVSAGLALAGPAAAEPYVQVRGADAEGPDEFDRTWVRRTGPRSARTVLVLVPGTAGGAGSFRLVARDLVRRVRGLQVWSWDRRANAFEDTSVFSRRDPAQSFGYYLEGQEVDGRRFSPVSGPEDAPFAREWGLEVALEDLRRVVQKARRAGLRVILGGHSLGAWTAQAYASWDFGGRPGYRDIRGLVLIDGSLKTGAGPTFEEVGEDLRELREGDPFQDRLGLGLPWASGVFSQLGALYARRAPHAPSALQDYPLLPEYVKPPLRVTNEGLLGYAFDQDTSAPQLGAIQVQAGRLDTEGDPRGWHDGEVTPIQRLARALSAERGNFSEWYFPRRLTLDLQAADGLERDDNARLLGLRTWHREEIDVPAYFFQTSLTRGGILRWGKRFVRSTRIPSAALVGDENMSHIDPLVAAPEDNLLLGTLTPFLRALRR